MDPVSELEVHEVTIQLSGQVNVQAFNAFQTLLRTFISDSNAIWADQPANTRRVQARVVRQAVRQTG
jgi:hypothetical protein